MRGESLNEVARSSPECFEHEYLSEL